MIVSYAKITRFLVKNEVIKVFFLFYLSVELWLLDEERLGIPVAIS